MHATRSSGGEVLLDVQDLHVWIPVREPLLTTLFRRRVRYIRAVDGVSFSVRSGEVFCIVGESGSGKTTLAKALVGLVKPTAGRIAFAGIDITSLKRRELKRIRREIQLIFQDPYESLNPNMRVFDIIAEPLEVNGLSARGEQKIAQVREALRAVQLNPPESFFDKYPHQLSGGQLQRVAIAAALVLRPKLIIADEPVSMLDASVKAEIIKLMMNLKESFNLTYLFITHDLAIARYVSDRIAVMYLGKFMEVGDVEDVIGEPLNPYTRALLSVAPRIDPRAKREKTILRGELPNVSNLPKGCRFHERCPIAEDICRVEEPQLREITHAHLTACHFAESLLKKGVKA